MRGPVGISMGFRVYIAKITFTTLIDHFTSEVLLIKLELRTQSINGPRVGISMTNKDYLVIKRITRVQITITVPIIHVVRFNIACFVRLAFLPKKLFVSPAREPRPDDVGSIIVVQTITITAAIITSTPQIISTIPIATLILSNNYHGMIT